MSAMLLAACNKKSDPTPAQNNEATNAQPTVSSAKAPVDEFENAENESSYRPHSVLKADLKMSTKDDIVYYLNFTPKYTENGLDDNDNLDLTIFYSYDHDTFSQSRSIKMENNIRFSTTGDLRNFESSPEVLDASPIYLDKSGNKTQIGEFVFTEDKGLSIKLCEEEFKNVCESRVFLLLPKKGTSLYNDIFESHKVNPLKLFPYQAEVLINLKNNNELTGQVRGTYDLKKELTK